VACAKEDFQRSGKNGAFGSAAFEHQIELRHGFPPKRVYIRVRARKRRFLSN
jgi:hypothetical protein